MAFVYDRTKDKAVDAARRMELGLSVHYHDDTDTTLLTFEDLEHNVKFDFTVRAPETRVRSGTGPDAREVRVAESATLFKEQLPIVMRPALRGRKYFDELGLTAEEFFELVRSAVFQYLSRGGKMQNLAPDFDVRWATAWKAD